MKPLVLIALLIAAGATLAQEVGKVISATPIVRQVGVPRQVCTSEQVSMQQPKSGAGAALGAIAGGAMGNALGHGAGNAAATAIGIVSGAIVGDRVEGNSASRVENVQKCYVQNFYESKTVGFDVVYEYAGKQYSVQMPNDPGPSIQLQLTPQSPTYSAQPIYQQAPAVVETGVIYPPNYQPPYYVQPYYVQPYYPPVHLNLGFGFWGGGYRHH